MGNKQSGSDDDGDNDSDEIDFLDNDHNSTIGIKKNASTSLEEEKLLDILLNCSNDIEALSSFLHENIHFDLNAKRKSFLCSLYIHSLFHIIIMLHLFFS